MNSINWPRFKKGSQLDPANYRPLSMLSLPGKVLESQFCRVLDEHLQTHNLYSNNQWGFRKGRSTETLLISMTERWRAALDDNKIVGAIFIDFRKAFDTISHELLPLKLQAVGIMGDSYNWIVDYLKYRSQFTTINGSSSSTKPINYGVPQGSLLGPRLSSIYVFFSFISCSYYKLVTQVYISQRLPVLLTCETK